MLPAVHQILGTPTGTNTSYVYNALGQRIRKDGGAPGTVYFMYDEAGHLVGEYGWNSTTSTLTLVQETVWLGDTPVATLRPNGGALVVFYVHTDQLNTPRKVTQPSGNQLRWKWDPTPFGEGAPNENPVSLGAFKYNLRLPGQYFDVESNLNHNYFRDYDPATGRFAESDPLGLGGGINSFGYVSQQPTMAVDQFGLSEADVVVILAQLRSNFPEIDPSGWDFDEPDNGNLADTSPLSGKMHFGQKYAADCLSLEDFTDLYSHVLHESMHSSDNPLVRLADSAAALSGTQNHSAIQNREDFEMDRLPHRGSKYPIYKWPMWKIPYDPTFNRKSIFEQIKPLYEKARPQSCICAE